MKFFLINRGLSGSPTYEAHYAEPDEVDPVLIGDGPRCPECGSQLGHKVWLPPHLFELSNTKYPDLLHVTFSLFASDRLLQIVLDNGITGIESMAPPATVVRVAHRSLDKLKKQPPVYREIHLIQLPLKFDERMSGFVRKSKDMCIFCQSNEQVKKYNGLILDTQNYDGTDLFEVIGWGGYQFASERAVEIFRINNVTGVDFVSAETYVPFWMIPEWWKLDKLSPLAR